MFSEQVVYMKGTHVPEAEEQILIFDSALIFGVMV